MNGGLFPNALHVARREYVVRVRGRTFVVTTVLLAIAVIVVTLLPTILQAAGVGNGAARVGVHTSAPDLASDPVAVVRGTLSLAGGEQPAVSAVDDAAAAARAVRDGELDGLLKITRAAGGDLAFEYLTDDGPADATRLLVTQAAQAIATTDRLDRAGIPPAEASRIFSPPPFRTTQADAESRDDADYGSSLMLAYVVVILSFMAIITYGNWVAQSVAEEKSNRVMELLVTAATPRQLLSGKVLGTGAAGLTQYLAMVGALLVGLLASGPLAAALSVPGGTFALPSVEPWMLPVFALFFLLGFTLYCTLYAAAGSMVSRIEDVQQAVGSLIFLSMAGYFVSFTALNAPDADWVAALSLVPFFSAYLIPVRMLLSTVAPGEIALALGILALTLALAVWVAARIYSAGVLLYGQRVGIRTVLRATRVAR